MITGQRTWRRGPEGLRIFGGMSRINKTTGHLGEMCSLGWNLLEQDLQSWGKKSENHLRELPSPTEWEPSKGSLQGKLVFFRKLLKESQTISMLWTSSVVLRVWSVDRHHLWPQKKSVLLSQKCNKPCYNKPYEWCWSTFRWVRRRRMHSVVSYFLLFFL